MPFTRYLCYFCMAVKFAFCMGARRVLIAPYCQCSNWEKTVEDDKVYPPLPFTPLPSSEAVVPCHRFRCSTENTNVSELRASAKHSGFGTSRSAVENVLPPVKHPNIGVQRNTNVSEIHPVVEASRGTTGGRSSELSIGNNIELCETAGRPQRERWLPVRFLECVCCSAGLRRTQRVVGRAAQCLSATLHVASFGVLPLLDLQETEDEDGHRSVDVAAATAAVSSATVAEGYAQRRNNQPIATAAVSSATVVDGSI